MTDPPPTITDPPGAVEDGPGWRLVGVRGDFEGREFELAQELVLGRDPEADIRLSDPRASRVHARVIRVSDGFYLHDEDSSNGTWLNGERIQEPVRLQDGDEIRIEDTVLRVASAAGAVEPASARAAERERARPPESAHGTSEAGKFERRWILAGGCLLLLLVTCACCAFGGVAEELMYSLGY